MSTLSMPVSLRRKLSGLIPAPRAVRKCGKVVTEAPAVLAKLAPIGSDASLGQTLPWVEIRTYAACSLQWRLTRDGTVDSVASGLLFSTCFRAALFHYYRRVREGREVPAGELLEIFEEQWMAERTRQGGVPVRWGAAEKDEANVLALAARIFAAFFAERGRRSGGEVVAVTEPFRIEAGGGVPPVAGVIDLLEIRDDDDGVRRLHLVRFKTASRRSALDELGLDQLHLYAMAACGLGLSQRHGLPLALRYDLFVKKKNPEIVSLAVNDMPRDFSRLAEKIRQIHHAMIAGIGFPAPSWRCAGCGFQQSCAAWPAMCASIASLPPTRENIPA